jgi:hypothetical protein
LKRREKEPGKIECTFAAPKHNCYFIGIIEIFKAVWPKKLQTTNYELKTVPW